MALDESQKEVVIMKGERDSAIRKSAQIESRFNDMQVSSRSESVGSGRIKPATKIFARNLKFFIPKIYCIMYCTAIHICNPMYVLKAIQYTFRVKQPKDILILAVTLYIGALSDM